MTKAQQTREVLDKGGVKRAGQVYQEDSQLEYMERATTVKEVVKVRHACIEKIKL